MTSNRKGGFTIIELLAVAMMIALMAGGTFLFGLNRYKTAVVRSTASKLMLTAKYARLSAVENQSRCRLVISEIEKKFFVMGKVTDPYTGVAKDSVLSNPYTKPTEVDENVSFSSVEISPNQFGDVSSTDGEHVINFMPDGTADNAVIELTNGKIFYTVTIASATAKAKVFAGQGGDIPAGVVDLDKESD
jgi:Tfp pilus assembly protein FimT